jgi:hypothetical protein
VPERWPGWAAPLLGLLGGGLAGFFIAREPHFPFSPAQTALGGAVLGAGAGMLVWLWDRARGVPDEPVRLPEPAVRPQGRVGYMSDLFGHAWMDAWIYSLRKPAAEPDPNGCGWVLRVPRRLANLRLVLCTVGTILFLGGFGALWEMEWIDEMHFWLVTGACALAGPYYVIEAYLLVVLFDERGMEIGRPVLGAVYLRWDTVRSVAFSEWLKVFTIHCEGGSSRWLTVYLNGLPALAEYLDRYAPGKLTPVARSMMLYPRNAESDSPTGQREE